MVAGGARVVEVPAAGVVCLQIDSLSQFETIGGIEGDVSPFVAHSKGNANNDIAEFAAYILRFLLFVRFP